MFVRGGVENTNAISVRGGRGEGDGSGKWEVVMKLQRNDYLPQ